jgi:hypothetical protein
MAINKAKYLFFTALTTSDRHAYLVVDNNFIVFNFIFINFDKFSETACLVQLPSMKLYTIWIHPKKLNVTLLSLPIESTNNKLK